MLKSLLTAVAAAAALVSACDECTGQQDIVQTRNVRRSQPGVPGATTGPRAPLSWGQINFLHTTDTHGWLEGHLKQQNYGADWGDFASFTKYMKSVAAGHGVDLLLVDTGDLHDGAGLSDATLPDGLISNPVFENIDYDLLTIGNHELYLSSVAYETFSNFSSYYGDKYLTSNVQILNPATNALEYIGKQFKYFTTPMGLRVMAFGVLFDFTGNSNATVVTKAATMVKQAWFLNAINTTQPVDMFIVLGHNIVRPTTSGSTFGTIFSAIRAVRPTTPIQFFGGHSHIRDFAVFDTSSTGIESGRYCETVGWVAVSGINSSSGAWNPSKPVGLPHPTQYAVKVNKTASTATSTPTGMTYFRSYLDWNRNTFIYHTNVSHPSSFGSALPFDTPKGVALTKNITADRIALNLSSLYGCAPQNWCQTCAPFTSPNNLFSLLSKALVTTVVNPARSTKPRLIILNTGSVRYDLIQGPFTYDDSFIVSPFLDGFQFLPNVPYSLASQIVTKLNGGNFYKREASSDAHASEDLNARSLGFNSMNTLGQAESCVDPEITYDALTKRSYPGGRIVRRQSAPTAGYTTTDDFGSTGDDTAHTAVPYYSIPNYFQANASFPANGSLPANVDLIYLDYFASNVVTYLNGLGANYSYTRDNQYYVDESFTTQDYLPAYAKIAPDWQSADCPISLA